MAKATLSFQFSELFRYHTCSLTHVLQSLRFLPASAAKSLLDTNTSLLLNILQHYHRACGVYTGFTELMMQTILCLLLIHSTPCPCYVCLGLILYNSVLSSATHRGLLMSLFASEGHPNRSDAKQSEYSVRVGVGSHLSWAHEEGVATVNCLQETIPAHGR
ncbi:hypothetical protein AMATHDRAFT_60758 [Amanita thiersii Skay4041]|uniref:Uncharacterized protein n=1 Tax=Amanita thiersii Skay4041 TaxID=703135 RepID=A0A2A9NMS7_9AGAR|nr:hypothetical protein AMATHDRAFT_60758 [Amanita thiersii Skay4041]